jgi:hypothetical protein
MLQRKKSMRKLSNMLGVALDSPNPRISCHDQRRMVFKSLAFLVPLLLTLPPTSTQNPFLYTLTITAGKPQKTEGAGLPIRSLSLPSDALHQYPKSESARTSSNCKELLFKKHGKEEHDSPFPLMQRPHHQKIPRSALTRIRRETLQCP